MAKKLTAKESKIERTKQGLKDRLHIADLESHLTRARSMKVGTAFGGIVEISMRSSEGYEVWSHLQPVEAIELIHQLAGQVGCHIHIQPRKDFASWREWNITEEEQKHFSPYAPQPDMRGLMDETAQHLPIPEEQAGLQPKKMAKKRPKRKRATKKSK
jgi:hypothetical protein|tara:strand:- start:665 stop:1138 length:474 start_codon:yes stop_codon:yes gene_type:complete